MKKTLLIILSLIGLGLTFAFADDATVTTGDSADTTTVEATATTGDSTTYDDADGNHDGKVDDFENCLFVEKKTKRECAKYLSGMAFSGVSFGSGVRSHFGSGMMFSGVRMGSGEFFSGDRRHFGSGTMFSGNTMGTGMRQNLGSGMQMFSGARQNIKNDRQEIWSNWAEFHSNWGFIGQYLKSDITSGEKAEVKNLIDTHAKEVRELVKAEREKIKAATGSLDLSGYTSELEESIKALQSEYVEKLLPYIDPAKQEEFKQFIEARAATVQENTEYRKDILKNTKKVYKYLSEKIRTNFLEKVSKLSDEQLQKIIDKADKMIASTQENSSLSDAQKTKIIGILEEVKSLLQDQLSSGEEDSEQQSILDEVSNTEE